MIGCKNCIYFERFKKDKTYLGHCKADPPVIIQSTENRSGQFPIVSEDNWCGTFVSSITQQTFLELSEEQSKEFIPL